MRSEKKAKNSKRLNNGMITNRTKNAKSAKFKKF